MSKTAFYFALYDDAKSNKLNNEDLHTMAAEFFWLMSTLEVDFDIWDTICNLITLSAEQTHPEETIEALQTALKIDGNPDDSTYFANHILTIHNALLGPEAPFIELTLPSLRMIMLTDDRLDLFLQTIVPKSFKLEKAPIERQKGLGHEIFEALFIEGKKFASNIASPTPPPPGTHLSPSPSQSGDVSKRASRSRSITPDVTSSRSPPSIKSTTPSVDDDNNSKKPTRKDEEEYELV